MADAQEYTGQEIGEYYLLRQLGRGTFGVVYLAEHIHDQTQVAIKLLRLQLTRSLELKDFLNEARVIRLRHPHIIPILDFGISPEDMPFLVMEYAPGGTLRDRFWHGMSLPLPEIVAYTSQLASALQFAHSRRLIHRDVKPENMLLNSNGTVLLSDFGIAKMMEQSTTMSHNSQAGTPAYMAPEQGQGDPCPASDQYALAVVVYEWLASRRPFLGTPLEVALQHRLDPPPPLRAFRPGIPIEAEQVILKALAKAPEERFETVEQFAQALQFAIDSSPTEKVPAFSSELYLPPGSAPRAESAGSNLAATMQRSPRNVPDAPPPQSRPTRALTPSVPSAPIEQMSTEIVEQSFDSAADPYRTVRWEGPSESSYLQELTQIAPKKVDEQAKQPQSQIVPKQVDEQTKRRQIIPKRFRLFPTLLTLLLICICCISGYFVFLLPQLNTQNAQSAYDSTILKTGVMFGFDAQHNNANTYEQILSAKTVGRLALKWTIKLPNASLIESSPTVANGLVYLDSADGKLYAFDAISGQQKWVASTQSSISQSSPAIDYGMVYIGAANGKLYAFDAISGRQKWVASTGDPIYSSPTVANGMVYIGSTDDKLYAFNAASGAQKWVESTDGSLVSSPAVANGLIYIGSENGTFYAFDATSGRPKWSASPAKSSSFQSSPSIANNLVYIAAQGNNAQANTLYAFDATSGAQKWAYPGKSFTFSSPAIAYGLIYVGLQNHQLSAFDASSGQVRWTVPTGDIVRSSPTIANHLVYASAQNGQLYAFDATSGKKEWAATPGGGIESSLTIANGMLYASSQNGLLYGYALN